MTRLVLVAMLALVAAHVVNADEDSHSYETGEEVTLWINKVGPYHNPQETYSYYSLPFCAPQGKKLRVKSESLGAALEGSDMTDSGIIINFLVKVEDRELCTIDLTEDVSEQFIEAVKHHYWYQVYLDDLPMWGMVGQVVEPVDSAENHGPGAIASEVQRSEANGAKGFLYTHKAFSISYNDNQIIHVNLTSSNPKPMLPGERIKMTYSVSWEPTKIAFDDRFDRYLDFSFFEHQIHWFSVFNSFMMVVFLCGLVVLVLMRTLKNDYLRYANEEEDMELDRALDEGGWKNVHGDVFRAPPHLGIYSALIGTGYQLVALVFFVTVIGIFGTLYISPGAVINSTLAVYSLTCFLSGFQGARYYKRNGGEDWKVTMFMTAVLFPGSIFLVAFVLNFVAMAYQSLTAISFGSILIVFAIWAFVAVPLVITGTIVGRNTVEKDDFPCRVNVYRRPIPDGKWYTNPVTLAFAGGVLPFGSIFIEMYFIFTSLWHYKFYYVYGFMLLVFLILIIVTMCVTVVSTYVLLNAEDYRWQWTCFFAGGSTAFYVYLYAIYYFFTKTRMYGFFQVSFYFGYMGLFCWGLFILCGTLGYMGSSLFVHKIYQYIKSD